MANRFDSRAHDGEVARGDSALNELFTLILSVAEEGEYDPEFLQTRLLPARESILRMEKRAALFSIRHPDEVELESAMETALEQLKEALGAVFLCLTGEEDLAVMGEAAQWIAQGGATAVACLKAMDSVAEAQPEGSADSVLETLFPAVKAQDSAMIEAALSALNESRQTGLGEVRALERIFAPHSWREEHLKPMLDILEEMERCGDSLSEMFGDGSVTVEQVAGFYSLAVRFDELVKDAQGHRPSLQSLPGVGRLRELMMLLGAVYERRAPISVLKEELEELIAGTKECVGSEAVELLRHTVHHDDVTHFPVLWDRLCDQK